MEHRLMFRLGAAAAGAVTVLLAAMSIAAAVLWANLG